MTLKKKIHSVRFAVLTISDTRDLATDKSGDCLCDLITSCGHIVAIREIVKDDSDAIISCARSITAPKSDIDALITTGGTGFTGRDVTIDSLSPLFRKKMVGFSNIFHMLSYQKIGSSTVQSRVSAGLINNCFVFCLPGSPSACRDAWNWLLRSQFDINYKPCNLVELFDRLDDFSDYQ